MISMQWMFAPNGITRERKRVADFRRRIFARRHLGADFETVRREDVALLAVAIFEQRNARGPIRIVFDRHDVGHDVAFLRLKSTFRYFCL